MPGVSLSAEFLVRLVVATDTAIVSLLFFLLLLHMILF